jgi:hypothetical protein
LTPETASFAPGGIWSAPNGLIISNASLSSIPVWQQTNPSNPNEVELIFDNSEGKIGGEFARFTEISVKRSVSRDGQANY